MATEIGRILTRIACTESLRNHRCRSHDSQCETLRNPCDISPQFRERLYRLCDSLKTEAQLSPFGTIMATEQITSIVKNHIRLRHWQNVKPDITRVELREPLFITGLPRSGTTFLQRLLAADPRWRTPAAWEGPNPMPAADERDCFPMAYAPIDARSHSVRVSQAAAAVGALAYLHPQWWAIHSLDPRDPEEDVLLLNAGLESQVPEALWYVPSYAEQIDADETAAARAYRTHRSVLQAMTAQYPGIERAGECRWLLKSPNHMLCVDELFDEYPDARILYARRDPCQVLGSVASLIAFTHALFTDRVRMHEIGARWLRNAREMLGGMRRARTKPQQAARILDVQYAELTADPLATVEKIYKWLDVPFDEKTRAIMDEVLREGLGNRRRYGTHRYDLGDFGLDAEQVRRELNEN